MIVKNGNPGPSPENWNVACHFFEADDQSLGAPIPMVESGNLGEIGWGSSSGGTPSSGTGPDAAASGTGYVYTEASGVSVENIAWAGSAFRYSTGISCQAAIVAVFQT